MRPDSRIAQILAELDDQRCTLADFLDEKPGLTDAEAEGFAAARKGINDAIEALQAIPQEPV